MEFTFSNNSYERSVKVRDALRSTFDKQQGREELAFERVAKVNAWYEENGVLKHKFNIFVGDLNDVDEDGFQVDRGNVLAANNCHLAVETTNDVEVITEEELYYLAENVEFIFQPPAGYT